LNYKKIPIENQRLVYGGREIQDELQLSQCNITDGATIFLVETSANANKVSPVNMVSQQQQQSPPQGQVQYEGVYNNENEISVSIQLPEEGVIQNNNNGRNNYMILDEENELSEQRINYVIELSYWIKCYCTFGLIISLISIIGCWFSIVPMLFYLFGMIGSRKLNRCGLVFPLLISALVGYGGSIIIIYSLIEYFNGWLFLPLFICLLHICIFSCICKLMCGINRLSNGELAIAKGRLLSRRCCC